MKTWRLDPPACDCRNICKNPQHDRPEWVEVTDDTRSTVVGRGKEKEGESQRND